MKPPSDAGSGNRKAGRDWISTLLFPVAAGAWLALTAMPGCAETAPAAPPVNTATGAALSRVFFVSNRDPIPAAQEKDPAEPAYFGERRGSLQYGLCSVRFTPIPHLQSFAASLPFYVPNDSKEVAQVQTLDAAQFWARVLANTSASGRLTAFIHGYNIGFRKSCRRAAIFQTGVDLEEQLILFSWPSKGKALNYTHDETDIAWSVPQIHNFVQQLMRHAGPRKVDLIGHSLGARGLVEALEHLACAQTWREPPINELVLLAPDIDTGTFAQQLPKLRQVARRITLYAAADDKPLRLSEEVHGYPRLGQGGPHLTLLPGVETIDVSDVVAYDLTGHQYHLYLPQVARDLRQLVGSGQGAERRPGLIRRSLGGKNYWAITP